MQRSRQMRTHRRAGSTLRPAAVATGVGLLALAAGSVAVLATATASAAGVGISFTPPGPFANGQQVTVTATGFASGDPVAISECSAGRAVTGPGDCAPAASGGSSLVSADANGVATATLTVIVGPVGNTTPPATTCGPANACTFYATNITDPSKSASTPIPYVGGSATPPPTEPPTTTPAPTDTPPVSSTPTLSVSPSTNLRQGQLMVVVGGGFDPNAPIAVAICPAGRPVTGPGDCAPSKSGGSLLATADAKGNFHVSLTAIRGPLHNQTPPQASCGPKNPCDVVATNIVALNQQVRVPLAYARGRG
jgi:hypothetical protein